MNKNYMLDKEFLCKLDSYPHRKLWARITALNFDEEPLEEITGKISAGSINVDGASAVRRTCSLTLVKDGVDINEFYWGLRTKFKLEVGLENLIKESYIQEKTDDIIETLNRTKDDNERVILINQLEEVREKYDYPDIIWFNQGIFLISSFNTSNTTNSLTISIQGKDKMVLLNGEVGGVIPASWDFGTIETSVVNEENRTLLDSSGYGMTTKEFYPIKDIVLQAVHEFAQEPWKNIIVNDLDDYGIELLEYQGDKDSPIYYIIPEGQLDSSVEVHQVVFSKNCYLRRDTWNNNEVKEGTSWIGPIDISEIDKQTNGDVHYVFNPLTGGLVDTDSPTNIVGRIKFDGSDSIYTVAKITTNDVCGFRICDIIYPYDLTMAAGDNITSMLDKLIQMLGNFEYFYDVEGRFVFQRKRTFTDNSYTNIVRQYDNIGDDPIDYVTDLVQWADNTTDETKYEYIFEKSDLISAIQNSPNLNNLKNDFSVWGARPIGSSGNTVPIHMRFAIDKKPIYYRVIGYTIRTLPDGTRFTYLGKLRNLADVPSFPQKGDVYKYLPTSEEESTENYGKYYFYDGTKWKFFEDSIYGDVGETYVTKEGKEKIKEILKNLDDDEKLEDFEIRVEKAHVCDWREIIFQMANDYRKNYHDDDFLSKVEYNNRYSKYDSFYPSGFTKYEKYYIDFEMNIGGGALAYWRELYNPDVVNSNNQNKGGIYDFSGKLIFAENWEKKRDYQKGDLCTKNGTTYRALKDNTGEDPEEANGCWEERAVDFIYNARGWNIEIINNPSNLNFWFDFLDTTGEINKFNVQAIGQRSKVTNNDKIKAIYYKEIPNVIFSMGDEKETTHKTWAKEGYTTINIPSSVKSFFTISTRSKSAFEEIEDNLYSFTYAASSISLTTIPIYYLTPNTLIYVDNEESKINGEYILKSYSIQLGLNSSMTISAMETPKRLY